MTDKHERLVSAMRQRYQGLDEKYMNSCADEILRNLDERLLPNLNEWIEGMPISDIWIGKYCINAIMSIHGDSDFLSALDAMNAYLSDQEAGIGLIWRGKR